MNKMRWSPALLLGVLLAAAGCAGKTQDPGVATAAGTPRASAGPSVAAEPDPVAYSRCMRENGMTWFPDPEDGRLRVSVPSTVDQDEMRAAEQACRRFSPHGGNRAPMDAAMLEQVRQMARCMRENGVPDFPDPQPDGSIQINGDEVGAGPGDPVFDAAEQLCSKFRPSRPPRQATS